MRTVMLVLLLMAAGIDMARAECATADRVRASVATEMPGREEIVVSGEAARRLGEKLADLTGASVPEGAYLIFAAPDGSRTYLVLLVDGCAARHGLFPAALVREWLGGLAS